MGAPAGPTSIVEKHLCGEIHFHKHLKTEIDASRCALSDKTSLRIIYFTDPADVPWIPTPRGMYYH